MDTNGWLLLIGCVVAQAALFGGLLWLARRPTERRRPW